MNTRPDGAMTWSARRTLTGRPFRVPCSVRWPGNIKPGTVTYELMKSNDWIPTFCAAAGEPDIVNKLKGAMRRMVLSTKSIWTGTISRNSCATSVGAPPIRAERKAPGRFFYSDDDGLLVAYRHGDYKYVSRSSACKGPWAFGPSRSRRSDCKIYLTSCKILSSVRISRPTRSGICSL